MKLRIAALALSALSAAAFADSLEPACRGTGVRTDLVGSYRSLGPGVWWDRMELGRDSADLYWNPSEHNQPESFKVWSCTSRGQNFLVYDFQNETFESILIGESPEGFAQYGEVFGADFTEQEVARLKRDTSNHVIHRRF
jgi:hypothetical protein